VQGRASVSSHQAPVRPCEGPLSGPGQKHGATAHAVRAVESVDGSTPAVEREHGMSESEIQANGSSDASRRQKVAENHSLG